MKIRRKLSARYISKLSNRKGIVLLSNIQLKIYRILNVKDYTKFITDKIKRYIKITIDENGVIFHNTPKIIEIGYLDLDRAAFVYREMVKELEKLQTLQKRYIDTKSCKLYNHRSTVQSRVDRNSHTLSKMHKELNKYYKGLEDERRNG